MAYFIVAFDSTDTNRYLLQTRLDEGCLVLVDGYQNRLISVSMHMQNAAVFADRYPWHGCEKYCYYLKQERWKEKTSKSDYNCSKP